MNTAVINFKTNPQLKKIAQKKASSLGLSLSNILNNSLKDFVDSSNSKPKTPYGIFSNMKTTDADIDEIIHSWDKALDEIG
ncbi:MAG: hypothetical protein AAB656_03175 [Patescibacteria group bacterium]